MRSGGWPGRICFVPNTLATDFHGSPRIKPNSFFFFHFLFLYLFCEHELVAGFLCSGLVFARLPQDRWGLHSFCTIHFAFRFPFAYAEIADGAECNRDWL
jgi:hypothetical protein